MGKGPGSSEAIKPTFHVSASNGAKGDVIVSKMEIGKGLMYEQFIYATKVENFQYEGETGAMRVVKGDNVTTAGRTGTLEAMDADPRSVSTKDRELFSALMLESLRNVNLNHFVDLRRDVRWSMDVSFDVLIEDNAPKADGVPEIVFFERGAGGGNSCLTIEALDAQGNVIGTPIALTSADGVHTSPMASVGTFDDALRQSGSQEMTGVALDLSLLGVTHASKLRLRTPVKGDRTTDGGSWQSGELQPDFKIVIVQTKHVQVPTWHDYD
jgi:hypothetical protein